MIRSPAETRDRWLNYGRRYAVHPTLHDGSVACMFGPLAPEAGTMQDYSGRTSGAAWSVGSGDVPKYVQGTVRGGSFWAGQYDGSNDYNAFSGPTVVGHAGSISSWIRLSTTSVNNTIFASIIAGQGILGYLTLSIMSDRCLTIRLREPGRYIYSTTARIDAGEFRHVAVTSNGSKYRMYVDGAEQNAVVFIGSNDGAWASDITSPLTRSYCGVTDFLGFTEFFSGNQAAQFVHSRELAPNEIATLARHPLAAFEVRVPKYWAFAPPSAGFRGPIVGSRIVRTKPSPLFIRGAM